MEKIGISYWQGPWSTVTKLCLDHNKTYFDKFYLISNLYPDVVRSGGIIHLPVDKFIDWVKTNITKIELKPNFLSDILTYYGIYVLEDCYGIYEKKILNLDTDYYVYNKLLLWDLFEHSTESISIKDEAEKLIHGDKCYWNCGALLTVKGDNTFMKFVEDYLDTHISEDMWYTEIGPRLVNSIHISNYFEHNPYSCIVPHTLDKGIITYGTNVIPKRHNALGCHLTDSHLRSLGYNLVDICEEGTNLIIEISNE